MSDLLGEIAWRTEISFHEILELTFNGNYPNFDELSMIRRNKICKIIASIVGCTPEFVQANSQYGVERDDDIICEWISQQLIDHPFQQLFEPCLKMFMAYEHNRSVTFSESRLKFEEKEFSDEENFHYYDSPFKINKKIINI